MQSSLKNHEEQTSKHNKKPTLSFIMCINMYKMFSVVHVSGLLLYVVLFTPPPSPSPSPLCPISYPVRLFYVFVPFDVVLVLFCILFLKKNYTMSFLHDA